MAGHARRRSPLGINQLTDWASYDNVAARYDDVWGDRFEAVARFVGDRLPLARGSCVLDIGTGTGIVLQALGARASESCLTGCDRSTGMIRVARSRVPAARLVAADAVTLPFRDSAFDVATASFVLSHLGNYEDGLLEARRVLKPGGLFAMTSWSTDADEHAEAWRELLAGAVSKELLQVAVARVVPREAHFESAMSVRNALTTAGFVRVEVHAHALNYTIPLDHFLADRELGSGGRFARHTLGPDAWARVVGRAREELGRRFGSVFECSRGVLLGLGHRAA